MAFNLFFWKKAQEDQASTDLQPDIAKCICSSGRNFEDCHEIEFALPIGERPDPD